LETDRARPEYRHRYCHAPVPLGWRPKTVPKPRRRGLSEMHDHPGPSVSLETAVRQFAERLIRDYGNRARTRPKALKGRVLALIRLHLPPYPKPSGRPQKRRITKATEMYTQQCLEVKRGQRERISWYPIAKSCIPGFRRIRSDYKRRAEMKRLRDSVYRRLRAKNKVVKEAATTLA
jgi:hypothetical protein